MGSDASLIDDRSVADLDRPTTDSDDPEKFICRSCNSEMDKELQFKYEEPCWLVCEISPRLKLTADLLPTQIKLNQKEYKLLCATYNTGASHFVGIFILNNKYYVVDD